MKYIRDHIREMTIESKEVLGFLGEEYSVDYSNGSLRIQVHPNGIYTIPESVHFNRLESLCIVGVSENDTVNIRVNLSAFSGCSSLESLDISHALLLDSEISFSHNLKHVTMCNVTLQNCTLANIVDALPSTVKFLTLHNVRTLKTDIGRECIDIGRLSSLYDLSIRDLDVDLSDTLDGLTSLNSLYIARCKDINIPPSISKLGSLKQLIVIQCGMTDFPTEVLKDIPLCAISLHDNRLSGDILDSLCNVSTLDIIDLSRNSISCQLPSPDTICHLSHLMILDISSNDFRGDINDEWIDRLPRLTNIYTHANDSLKMSLSNQYKNKVNTHYRPIPYVRYS